MASTKCIESLPQKVSQNCCLTYGLQTEVAWCILLLLLHIFSPLHRSYPGSGHGLDRCTARTFQVYQRRVWLELLLRYGYDGNYPHQYLVNEEPSLSISFPLQI